MADEPSQEELLAQQKANCIFCKIVAGEIPSKSVYEDERMAAVLDINPAAKGHTLVMTKEHYPIMPLIPPEEFAHLFGKTAPLSGAVAAGALTKRCTTFIANGAVAGQQSPHFLFHLIPREQGDGLDKLSVPARGVNQSDLAEMMRRNLYAVMRQHLTQTGKLSLLQTGSAMTEPAAPPVEEGQAATPAPTAQTAPAAPPEAAQAPQAAPVTPAPAPRPAAPRLSLDQLGRAIEENPEIKALLINNPAKLQGILAANPELRQIFAGVDVERLGAALRQQHLAKGAPATTTGEGPPAAMSAQAPTQEAPAAPKEAALVPARELTLPQIFAFVDRKPRLKQLMLYDPEGLKRLIPENERLSRFFEQSNVNAIIQAYQEHAKATHGVRATVEPSDKEEPEGEPAKRRTSPNREQAEDAWDEVRGSWGHKADLDRIGRLFR